MNHIFITLGALVMLWGMTSHAQSAAPATEPAAIVNTTKVPSAAQALAAWQDFRVDPLARLDRTQPFLGFIRDSGQVHIVLNNNLLAWMYQAMDDALKATLYAAFLGGDMAAQLENRHSGGSDNVAGMTAALDAYANVRKTHPDFQLPMFERLASARAQQRLAAAVKAIEAAEESSP